VISGDYNSVAFDGLQVSSDFMISERDGHVKLIDEAGRVLAEDTVGHSIVYITGGGTTYAAKTNIAHGTVVASPGTPKRPGYKFSGWYADKKFTKPWDFSTPITQNIWLYAKWRENNEGGFASWLPSWLTLPTLIAGIAMIVTLVVFFVINRTGRFTPPNRGRNRRN